MRYRLTLVSVFLLGALLAAGAASARMGNLVLDRGIVQSVSAGQVVLRALDGSTIPITVGPKTKVFLNDAPAPLSAIQPGYVVGALHDGSRPAVYVRAVGRAVLVVDKGVIVSVSPTSLVLRTGCGAHHDHRRAVDGGPAERSVRDPGRPPSRVRCRGVPQRNRTCAADTRASSEEVVDARNRAADRGRGEHRDARHGLPRA